MTVLIWIAAALSVLDTVFLLALVVLVKTVAARPELLARSVGGAMAAPASSLDNLAMFTAPRD